MRMVELSGKQIINIANGVCLGMVGESDLTVELSSGRIQAIIVPRRSNPINFWVEKQCLIIPWEAVKKIGTEVIIVDLDQTNLNFNRYSI